ncbi:MAG: hypothetical protein DRP13_00545 [Candidatus Aenigmatarchaeota archaeon]|nr:MAG: hypothetical protein DRP13_00545 [Candidatus Aenigmarchaeota archaeon]
MNYQQIIFIRHFKPKIDKSRPITEWELDDDAILEMEQRISKINFKNIEKVFTSPEKKALTTAKFIANNLNIRLIVTDNLKEVDRSKTGFIEGDYKQIVKDYFTAHNFKYEWEPLEKVKERIKRFLITIKDEGNDIVVVSHGMYLSILLSPYFQKDIVSFWNDLKLGEIITVKKNRLLELWGILC